MQSSIFNQTYHDFLRVFPLGMRIGFPKLLCAAATVICSRAGAPAVFWPLWAPWVKGKGIQDVLLFWQSNLKIWLLSLAREPTMAPHCLPPVVFMPLGRSSKLAFTGLRSTCLAYPSALPSLLLTKDVGPPAPCLSSHT